VSARGRRDPLRALRLAAFVVLVGFMAFGPCYRQALGGRSRVFRPWWMFAGMGLGVVEAHFFERRPDGSERPIDRFALLGHGDAQHAPRELRRLVGREATLALARRLCDAVGPGADVRARARIATRAGWRALESGEQNLCLAAPPPAGDAP
jgi:hypothetical protein